MTPYTVSKRRTDNLSALHFGVPVPSAPTPAPPTSTTPAPSLAPGDELIAPKEDYFTRKRAEMKKVVESTSSKRTNIKTKGDVAHLMNWLKEENNETRAIENIPKDQLEIYLSVF